MKKGSVCDSSPRSTRCFDGSKLNDAQMDGDRRRAAGD